MINEKTYELLDAYLNGILSTKERRDFEVQMTKDRELREEMLLQKDLYEVMFLHEQEEKQLKKVQHAISEAHSAYHNFSTPKRRIWRFVGVTASILLLLGYFMFFKTSNSMESLYAEYADWDSLPSLTERTGSGSQLEEAAIYFKEASYTKAISSFEVYLLKDPENPLALTYLGLSYIYSQNYDKAIETFDRLEKGTSLDRDKSYWYKAMAYLKAREKDKAIATLRRLIQDSNNYKYEVAKQLLKRLE